jgi:hypothetical protein
VCFPWPSFLPFFHAPSYTFPLACVHFP